MKTIILQSKFLLIPIIFSVLLLGFSFNQDAHAATITAAPGGGFYEDGSTWIGGEVPQDGVDDVIIPSGVTVTANDVEVSITDTTFTVQGGILDLGEGGFIVLQEPGSTLNITDGGTLDVGLQFLDNFGTINIISGSIEDFLGGGIEITNDGIINIDCDGELLVPVSGVPVIDICTPSLSDDATLSSLSIDSGLITPSFNPTIFSYSSDVLNTVTDVTISATTNHPGATVTGDGLHSLNVDVNNFPITVTSESGIVVLTYTVTITRNAPPTVNITTPEDGASFDVGTDIVFTSLSSVPGDSTSSWISSIDGEFGNIPDAVTIDSLSPGVHTISLTLRVTGVTLASDSITITINDVVDPNVTVIDVDTIGNQNVGTGETLKVTNGATVDGKITVDGGTLILEDNCVINGNVKSTNGGNVSIDSCTVNGHVRTDGGSVTVIGSSIGGNLNAKNTGSVTVANSALDKNLRVDGTVSAVITNNNVGENLRVKNSANADLSLNIVGGHLRSFDNQDTHVDHNTITGNLNTAGTNNVIVEDNIVEGSIRASDSQSVRIEANTSGENLRVKDSTDIVIGGNDVGKHLRVFGNTSVEVSENQVAKNLNIKNNSDCHEFENTVNGKVRVKDCTSDGLSPNSTPGI